MAAAPVPPDTPPDITLVITVFHQVQQWLWWIITGGFAVIGTLIWKAASERQQSAERIRAHGEHLAQHDIQIKALQDKDSDIVAILGAVPTRAEFVALGGMINDRFDRLDRRLDAARGD